MSCASRHEGVKFILGCGDSMANAINSGALPNFCAIVSNGGEFAGSRREPGSTMWHGEQCCCASRLPLSASAANALCATKGRGKQHDITSQLHCRPLGLMRAFSGLEVRIPANW